MATPHVAGVMALWTQKLFAGQPRPLGWTRDVQVAVESNVKRVDTLARNDIGIGIVQAPQ